MITRDKELGNSLPDSYIAEESPDVRELDELETFVGSNKTPFVDSCKSFLIGNFRLGSLRP
jgi:hypothetical protein